MCIPYPCHSGMFFKNENQTTNGGNLSLLKPAPLYKHLKTLIRRKCSFNLLILQIGSNLLQLEGSLEEHDS